MGNKYFSTEDDDDSFNLDSLTEDEELPFTEVLVRKCYCGYRGALVPDILGYVCANCGHLLVEDY